MQMRRVRIALYIGLVVIIIYLAHPSSTLGPRFHEWKEEDAARVKDGAQLLRFDTPLGHG